MVVGLCRFPAVDAVEGLYLWKQSLPSGFQDLLSCLIALRVLLFVSFLFICYKLRIVFTPPGSLFSKIGSSVCALFF